MRKPTKIPIEQVHRVQEILESAPDVEPDAVTTRAAIATLSSPIARLKARGHSLRRIAEILSTNGIPITYETLSTYLTLSKDKRDATRTRKPEETAKDPDQRTRRQRARGRTATADPPGRIIETKTADPSGDVPAESKSTSAGSEGGRSGAQSAADSRAFTGNFAGPDPDGNKTDVA